VSLQPDQESRRIKQLAAKEAPLTFGSFHVQELLGWDSARGVLYFSSSHSAAPYIRHVYRISSNRNSMLANPTCLTCHLGSTCTWASGLPSKDFSRLLIQCKGPSPPHQLLLPLNPPGAATSLKGPSPTPLAWPSTTVVSMDLPSGDQLHARLHLPPHLLEDDGRRAAAPLLLHFPPSIGQQVVTSRWSLGLPTYLASSLDIAVLEVDGLGSSGKGGEKRLLGAVGVDDVKDIKELIKWAVQNFTWLDRSRLGVMGTNYGGYLSLLTDSQVACRVATAPVVNWRLHDAVETEKFLGSPNNHENFHLYGAADLLSHLGPLQDNSVLIVHGTEDRLVDVEQSMSLAKVLADRGTLFHQQIYTGEGSGLVGVQRHFINSVTSFLNSCLMLDL